MTQRNRVTPTEPVAAKMLDGVEKTRDWVSMREPIYIDSRQRDGAEDE